MHYKFPIIETIADVLPHIEGRSEFVVAEREFGTVINYVVAMADTFDMTDSEDLGGAIRREARGLIFDKEGRIMSRPFHKFFNVNEREETMSHHIDTSQPHIVMEKMDGSMIRPILVDGHLRLATKMGITDVAMQAEVWLAAQHPSKTEWLRYQVENGMTPLFEWVSPMNQIVLEYEDADLVYLGSRSNTMGDYFFRQDAPFTFVARYGSLDGNMTDYIARARQQKGREGDIIRFADGHMLKVKNDWYVRIHKIIDQVKSDRNIVSLILHEELDDVLSMLPETESVKVRAFERKFWDAFQETELRLLKLGTKAAKMGSRKDVALELIPTLEHKEDAQFIFRLMDGGMIRELLTEYVLKMTSTNTKWDATAKWLKISG